MKNIIAYCRVSTAGQTGEDKFGLDAQREQIEDYCRKNDLNILDWYIDEGISGVCDNRPALDKILYDDEFKNPPYEAVVVAKSDRIAREIKLYFYYEMLLSKKNVQLISVVENFGDFGAFSGILKSFTLFVAEQERVNIQKRTSGGRKIKASKGGYSGGRVPYGYEVTNGVMTIKDSEEEIVRKIFEMHAQGVGLLQTANKLNDMGFHTRKGGQFYASNIKSIIENEKTYRGFYKYGGADWVKGQHEPILK